MAEVDATRACVVCGTLFARYKTKSVCSDACAAIRQRKYQATSNARNVKPTRQCRWCANEFTPAHGAGYAYCCTEHQRLAKLAKDRAREVTPEQRASWNKKYNQKHADKVRERGRIQAAKRRAKHGRGDRSGEYLSKRIKKALARMPTVARALAEIVADGCKRQVHVPDLLAAVVRLAGRTDKAARLVRSRAIRATSVGTLSDYTLALKADPQKYAAALSRWRAKSLKRKTGKAMKSDGTASAAVMLGGSYCLYCDCKLTETNRSHDHMTPLVLGGVHSAANIAPSCIRCNTLKGSKDFVTFVSTLRAKDQQRAIKFYEKRNGSVRQMGLCLAA